MRKSGYRTVLHIYLLFFLSLLGTILAAGVLIILLITVRKPDGSTARSDWPKTFTESFQEQILFIDGAPQLKQAGIALLHENEAGLQILSPSGEEVFQYQRPQLAKACYSTAELLRLSQTGSFGDGHETAYTGTAAYDGKEFPYILYFPMKISKVTMYLNGEHFTGGKAVILSVFGILFLAVLVSGVLYGVLTARAMKRLTASIRDISARSYLSPRNQGVFHDLYDSLNVLDAEIRRSDQLQRQTDQMREEWIANITHDLKTPLSPIRGYAEILLDDGGVSGEQRKRYAGIQLKNVSYMEKLIDDLKLTYQLENGMLPTKREEQNVVRFLREVVIDILNTPEYEDCVIHFESDSEIILYSFDQTLLTRAFRNLMVNAFVHGEPDTEITLRVAHDRQAVWIDMADNGQGMKAEERERLFDRYYRGTGTEKKPEGTGLGLAIAKGIIELHGGTISVSGNPGGGTVFQSVFPHCPHC